MSKNVIRTVKDLIGQCDLIKSHFSSVNFDFNDQTAGKAGLFQNGFSVLGEDIVGNTRCRLNFTLYANFDTFKDYDRLNNSDFMLAFSNFLAQQKRIEISEAVGEQEKTGEITKITPSGGVLFALNNEDFNDGGTYQLNLSVEYTINDGG